MLRILNLRSLKRGVSKKKLGTSFGLKEHTVKDLLPAPFLEKKLGKHWKYNVLLRLLHDKLVILFDLPA